MTYIKERLNEDNRHSYDVNVESVSDEPYKTNFFKKKPKANRNVLDIYLASEIENFSIYKGQCAPLENLPLELNTPLPSSAACERLFSCGGLILRPNRSSLSDSNFEACLLTRCNKLFA